MTGIYIHIPFCKKVCNYCDFHFSVSLKLKDKVMECIGKELVDRVDYLPSKTIETIYFGGGTPSILSIKKLSTILNLIYKHFIVSEHAEITLEANPDDITIEYLYDLKSIGINRLSIGIQSFNDDDLVWMNRRHTAAEAINSVKLSHEAGFENINIDLIYGLPNLTLERWKQNLETFISLQVPHLSAYHLSVEPKTVLGYYKRKGKLTEIDENDSLAHYGALLDVTKANGYKHYEISNFCTNENFSKHNTNYWKQGHYIGLGPSAHSYNGISRQWNTSVNSQYIKAIETNQSYFDIEQLTDDERFNDYILTHLRTSWGANFEEICMLFGDKYLTHFKQELKKYKDLPTINISNDYVSLTDKGMFVSDKIIEELFWV